MLKKVTFFLMVLTIFTVTSAFANSGCKNGKFVGTYTLAIPNVDVLGDGSVIHSFANQLTLHSDGNVNQYFTGLPDYMLNTGSGTPQIGSWTCRNDGMLVVTYLSATYVPSVPSGSAPTPDITLLRHVRVTGLFSVEDKNTLKRVQARARIYNPSQDPTDPNGGTLGALSTTPITYNRLIASDADLLAP